MAVQSLYVSHTPLIDSDIYLRPSIRDCGGHQILLSLKDSVVSDLALKTLQGFCVAPWKSLVPLP